MVFIKLAISMLLSVVALSVQSQTYSVSFIEPVNNAVVRSPFKAKFAVEGMNVRPAGDMSSETGHFHILINREGMDEGEPIPFDEKHIHFGRGQTETFLNVPAGRYRLTLQFADGAHLSYGRGMSQTIEILVE